MVHYHGREQGCTDGTGAKIKGEGGGKKEKEGEKRGSEARKEGERREGAREERKGGRRKRDGGKKGGRERDHQYKAPPTPPHSTPPMPYFLIHDFKYMNLWEAFLFSPPVVAALSKVRTIFHTQCSVVA